MNGNVFKAIITVLDRASAPLRAIQGRITALTEPMRNVGSALANIGRYSGINQISAAAGNAAGRVRHLAGSILELAGPLGALGAGASIAGLVELTRRAWEYGAQIYDTSIKTGVAAEQLQSLHYAAQLTGTSTEAMDKGLTKLNRTIAEAAAGKNKDAAALFQKLGISLRDANGHFRTAGDLMPQLAAAFEKNENPALRARMAFTLWSRSGAEMIPLMSRGSASLIEMREEAEHLGLVMSSDAVKSAKAMEDSWLRLEGATRGLSNAIGAQLFPILKPLVDGLTEWIAANRQIIATNIREIVTQLATALRSVDWEGWGRGIRDALASAWSIIEAVGGMKTVLIGLAVFMAGPFVASLFAVATAFKALGAAMLFTPIGLIVTGIAAVAAGAYLIYRNWGSIGEFFRARWDEVIKIFRAAWEEIRPIIDGMKFVWNAPGRAGAAIHNYIANSTPPTGPDDAIDPTNGLRLPGPRLYGPGGVVPQAGGRGQTDVNVRFENAPAGMRVQSSSSGAAPDPNIDVGYAFGGSMAPATW